MAAAVPMTSQDFVDGYDLSIHKIFLKAAKSEKTMYQEYFNVDTSITSLLYKDSSLSGLGEADFVDAENAILPGDSPVQGYDKTFTQEKIAHFMAFTEKNFKFNIEFRKLQSIVKECRAAVVRKRERLCAERVNNMFSTVYTASGISGGRSITITGGDGLAFASAAHTREDGGSNWSNIVTDAAATVNLPFDYSGLKAAHRTAAAIPDPKGNPMNLSLDTLICVQGSATFFKAQEMLSAIKRNQIPGSANNDGSGVMAFKVIALPSLYVTNVDYWVMFDSSKMGPDFGWQFLESQQIMLSEPNTVFKTDEVQYKASSWFALGHNDPRIAVCSKATSAA